MGQKHLSIGGTSGLASVTDIVEGFLVKQDNGCPVVLPPRNEDGLVVTTISFFYFILVFTGGVFLFCLSFLFGGRKCDWLQRRDHRIGGHWARVFPC